MLYPITSLLQSAQFTWLLPIIPHKPSLLSVFFPSWVIFYHSDQSFSVTRTSHYFFTTPTGWSVHIFNGSLTLNICTSQSIFVNFDVMKRSRLNNTLYFADCYINASRYFPCPTISKLVSSNTLDTWCLTYVEAGHAGFEPASAGVKVLCLTTWRMPIIYLGCINLRK